MTVRGNLDKMQSDDNVTTKEKAELLSSFINMHYKCNMKMACEEIGVPRFQLNRWLQLDAIVIKGCIYLMRSSFPESDDEKNRRTNALDSQLNKEPVFATALEQHIELHYKNANQSMFARDHSVRQQQVFRWVNSGLCVFLLGQVYRLQFVPEKRLLNIQQ